MSLQENLRTVSDYDFSGVPNLQTAVGFVDSIHKETNRKPDKYFFWIDKDGLVDPATGKYLHDIFTPQSQENPYLGKIEYEIIRQLDKWSISNTHGFAIWISPEYGAGYRGNKVIIHKIDHSPAGQNLSRNTAILFDCSKESCFQIMREFFPEISTLSDSEELRSVVITRDEKFDMTDLLARIDPFIPKGKNYREMTEGERNYIGDLIIQRKSSYFIANEMQRLGILGPYLVSCGGLTSQSFSSFVLERSEIAIGFFACPNCGGSIPSGLGITKCPHCGITKEEYGSTCD